MNHPQSIYVLTAIGLLLRLPFVPFVGFEQDFLFFSSWATHLADQSLLMIYDDPQSLSVGFINYPPLYLYILFFLARIYRLFFSGPLETQFFMMMIKTTTILIELGFSLILYRWIAKRNGQDAGRLAFGLYFLNPAVIYVSAYYGQVDAFFAGLLFLSIVAFVERRGFASGGLLAAALLAKLQALPFVPFLFLAVVLMRKWLTFLKMAGGFITVTLVVVSPFAFAGQVDEMFHNCVIESIKWGKYLSVGAFNFWYFHADPYTLDFRILGWLYGGDGRLIAFPAVSLFTYKNLGAGLFGLVFLWSLYWSWKRKDENSLWVSAAHLALAFYLLPTKVHERYLYPFFLLYLPIVLRHPIRRGLFYGFSVTYLINVMVICPLFINSQPVETIDSTIGIFAAILNVIFYSVFLAFEYGGSRSMNWDTPFIRKAVSLGAAAALFLFLARSYERLPNFNRMYLSQLHPVNVQQTWPPVAEELPPGYRQLKRDLSSDGNTLQIKNTYFRYGLGAHAESVAEYEVSSEFDYFESWIGVDAEVLEVHERMPHVATVTFEVWINGEKKYQSPLLVPSMPARHISVPLDKTEKTNRIRLVVRDGGDQINETHSDHANWALARVMDVEKTGD